MTHRLIVPTIRTAGVAFLVSALLGTAAFAQRPGPPPFGGPGGPGGRFGGPGGPGGPRRGMRGPRPISLANTPLSALSPALKLTGTQKSKIATIQALYRAKRQHLMPRPGDGPPPPRPGMGGGMEGMRGLEEETNAQIKGTLTASQKAALPGVMKTLDDLRFAGIPLETYGDLKLSAGQKAQISGFAQSAQQTMRRAVDSARQTGDFGAIRETMRSGHDQVMHKAFSVLTVSQKAIVSRYKAAHPQRDRPGGGFGPPPPGGRGFGPPPPDVL